MKASEIRLVARPGDCRHTLVRPLGGRMQGAGGTPGGVGAFLLGLGMVVVGAYLLLTRVTVGSGAWLLWGYSAFGMSLLPLLIGIGWLFFDGRSVGGWVPTVMGALIIFAGIIANLHIYFAA